MLPFITPATVSARSGTIFLNGSPFASYDPSLPPSSVAVIVEYFMARHAQWADRTNRLIASEDEGDVRQILEGIKGERRVPRPSGILHNGVRIPPDPPLDPGPRNRRRLARKVSRPEAPGRRKAARMAARGY